MSARRDKSKNALTEEVANEVVLEVREEEDEGGSLRRPVDPQDDKGFWGKVEQGARIAASLGVFGAAVFGIIEYRAANEDTRRERSMDFVQAWENAGQIDRYTRVQAFVEERLNSATLPPPDLPDEVLRQAYRNLGYNWLLDLREEGGNVALGTEADVDRLTLFFAQMFICIDQGLCNASVLEAYFKTEVTSFWQYFEGYATLRREAGYEGYGEAVGKLVDMFSGPGAA